MQQAHEHAQAHTLTDSHTRTQGLAEGRLGKERTDEAGKRDPHVELGALPADTQAV
jgi:hypothetical protein